MIYDIILTKTEIQLNHGNNKESEELNRILADPKLIVVRNLHNKTMVEKKIFCLITDMKDFVISVSSFIMKYCCIFLFVYESFSISLKWVLCNLKSQITDIITNCSVKRGVTRLHPQYWSPYPVVESRIR